MVGEGGNVLFDQVPDLSQIQVVGDEEVVEAYAKRPRAPLVVTKETILAAIDRGDVEYYRANRLNKKKTINTLFTNTCDTFATVVKAAGKKRLVSATVLAPVCAQLHLVNVVIPVQHGHALRVVEQLAVEVWLVENDKDLEGINDEGLLAEPGRFRLQEQLRQEPGRVSFTKSTRRLSGAWGDGSSRAFGVLRAICQASTAMKQRKLSFLSVTLTPDCARRNCTIA